jgi:hypothetical protein
MKYSIRHLFALMVLAALAVQAWHAYKVRQHVAVLEDWHGLVQKQLREVEEQAALQRTQVELCRSVADAYDYPGDFAAAKRRFARLKAGDPQGD